MALYKYKNGKLVKVAGNYSEKKESVRILSTSISSGNATLPQSISNFKTLTFIMTYGSAGYYVCNTVPVPFFKLLTGSNNLLIAFDGSRYVGVQYVNDTTVYVSNTAGGGVLTGIYGNY